MSELLSTVSSVEKELSLLDGILDHIYIFGKESNELIIRLKIGDPRDFNAKIVGGLVATVDDFTAKGVIADKTEEEQEIKYITLVEIKFIFITTDKYVIVAAVDPEYPISQYGGFMHIFRNAFEQGLDLQESAGDEDEKKASVSVQIMTGLISEEFKIELILSENSKIFPYKLQEMANSIIDNELMKGGSSEVSTEDDIEIDEQWFTLPNMNENLPETQSIINLLEKFSSTFGDLQSITYIHIDSSGNFEKLTQGALNVKLEAHILHIVLGMIDTVVSLLDMDESARTLDLGDNWIYFHRVSNTSFVYIIVESQESLDLMKPLVQRVITTINNIFPEG